MLELKSEKYKGCIIDFVVGGNIDSDLGSIGAYVTDENNNELFYAEGNNYGFNITKKTLMQIIKNKINDEFVRRQK